MSLIATGTQLPWHDPGAAEEDKCCCAPECCLYSAYSLSSGGLFLVDLAEAITYVDDGTPYSWGKLGAIQTEEVFAYNVGTATWDSIGNVSFCYEYTGGYFIGYKTDGSTWAMVVYNAGDDRYELLFTLGECLIQGDGNFTPNDNIIEDQFAAQYVVDDEAATVLTRVSLCRWEGGGRILSYDDNVFVWELTGPDGPRGKDAPQSDPAGTYDAETVTAVP